MAAKKREATTRRRAKYDLLHSSFAKAENTRKSGINEIPQIPQMYLASSLAQESIGGWSSGYPALGGREPIKDRHLLYRGRWWHRVQYGCMGRTPYLHPDPLLEALPDGTGSSDDPA